jgi:hypothetical protein
MDPTGFFVFLANGRTTVSFDLSRTLDFNTAAESPIAGKVAAVGTGWTWVASGGGEIEMLSDLLNTRLVYNVSTADLPALRSSTTHITLTVYDVRVFVGFVTFTIKYEQL